MLGNIFRPFLKTFYLTIAVIAGQLLCLLIKPRKKKLTARSLSLSNFNPATQQEKNQMFMQWAWRQGAALRRCDVDELEDYAAEFNLPQFNDWKEIHGYSRLDWVSRDLYLDWVKFLGAYNPAVDPSHPDWEGR